MGDFPQMVGGLKTLGEHLHQCPPPASLGGGARRAEGVQGDYPPPNNPLENPAPTTHVTHRKGKRRMAANTAARAAADAAHTAAALRRDCEFVENGGLTEKLCGLPLWHSEQPGWAAKSWTLL